MNEITIGIIINVVVILIGGVVTFYKTNQQLIQKIQETRENLKDLINKSESNSKEQVKALELEIERLKGKDENQQQIIEQFQKQVLDHLPDLFEILKDKKGKK